MKDIIQKRQLWARLPTYVLQHNGYIYRYSSVGLIRSLFPLNQLASIDIKFELKSIIYS